MKNTDRLEHLFDHDRGIEEQTKLTLYHGDMTDGSSLTKIITKVRPTEIYNLAAQSHVRVSFEEPEYTADTDALGLLRILECVLHTDKTIKVYQASTSELFGGCERGLLNESSVMNPRSPYAAAKL